MITENIINLLEQVRLIPGILLDKEEDVIIFDEVNALFQKGVDSPELNEYISTKLAGIRLLLDWVEPYKLPEDYLFFQCLYGGLDFRTKEYNFYLNGLGPHTDEWYFPIFGDTAWTEPKRDGLLTLGDIELQILPVEGEVYYTLLMDLGGILAQEYNIIAVGPMTGSFETLYQVLKEPVNRRNKWAVVAQSFSHLLEQFVLAKGELSWLVTSF